MNLVHLSLRRGEAVAEARQVEGSDILYFCAKDWCPHYQGQLGILAGAETMHCALIQYPPNQICRTLLPRSRRGSWTERRATWEQRLAEAEAFESAVAAAAGATA